LGNAQDTGRVVGRYVLYDEIASGGMATIHLGRMLGQVGFTRTVAIKRLHPHFAKDPEFVAMFIDEARLAAGISHPNVVSTLDVVALEGDLFLVMDYVEGDSLSHLVKRANARDQRVPPAVVSGIVSNVLYGLHAAHTATDDRGEPLSIVHRDVSPQNVLVGLDGVARVVDFGVAKASRRIMETEAGRIKGKFRYMAPEQVRADKFDHRVDVFAAGIVLWEALTGRALFAADEPMRTMTMVLDHPIPPPSSLAPDISSAVDAVVLKALARPVAERYATAREMAVELEDALGPAVPRVIGDWVDRLVGESIRLRAARLIELGSESNVSAAARGLPSAAPSPVEPAAPAPAAVAPASFEPTPPTAMASALATAFAFVPVATGETGAPPPVVAPPAASFEGTPVAASALRPEPSSQVSEVSAAAWDTAAQRSLFPAHNRQLKVVLAAVAGAMGLFLVASLAVLSLRSGPDEQPDVVGVPPTSAPRTAMPVGPAVPALAPVAVGSAAPAVPTSEPPKPAAPTPEPVASASPETDLPKPAASKPKPEVAPTAVKATPKHPDGCNPPWIIDDQGIKKFKRHCM
jgi:serine/threonine-protein kinase